MESQPFWDAMREHRLIFQQCVGCGKIRHYPRPVCDRCFSMEARWQEATGFGKVHSWTECHHAFHPSFMGDLPYLVLTVDMDEGVRMVGQADRLTKEALSVGLPVEIAFRDIDGETTLPVFRARAQS